MPCSASVPCGVSVTALDGLAAALSGMEAGPVPKAIEPLRPKFVGRLLAFDQTLAKAASILLVVRGTIVPFSSAMHETSEMARGNEDSLLRGTDLFLRFKRLLADLHPDLVSHETPPVSSIRAKMSRPESSLCAALALRCAAADLGIPVHMVGAQRGKTRLTGNSKAEKRDVKAAIERMVPEVLQLKPWNQDISDAMAVGIVTTEEVGG